jgi:DNA-binding protein WhiA
VTRGFQPTEQVIGELSRLPAVLPRCCLLAEIGAALRICGTVGLRSGQTAVEADFAGYPQAARLRTAITTVFGYRPPLQVVLPAGGRKRGKDAGAPRYLLVAGTGRDAEHLILSAGLTGPAGQPLAGMPRPVVAGRRCDCAAGWRGAFLAAGTLFSPQRARPLLTVACPSRETALALDGTARRMGIAAHLRKYRGTCHAAVAGPDGITRLLDAIGSPGTAREWLARWEACQARTAADPGAVPAGLGQLDGSNLTRSRQAADKSAMRARRALEILGRDTPGYLQQVAQLRIDHPYAELGRLGMMADPPLSKDTIAGRLRRLNAVADARAAELGIPGTEEALPGLAAAS